MNEVLKYFLESGMILAFFYLIYRGWLYHDKHFRFTRLYLLASSMLAILLPLIRFPISAPSLQEIFILQQSIQLPEVLITAEALPNENPAFSINWPEVMISIYLIGMIFLISRILAENLYLLNFIRKNKKNGIRKDHYWLIPTKGRMPTSSWFDYLFWDETNSLTASEQEQVLKHEEAHILNKHTLDILYIEILKAIFWPNPFIHGYRTAIVSLHEWQADDYVIRQSNMGEYLNLLARQIMRSFNLQISHQFGKSKAVRRIRMMKSNRRKPLYLTLTLSISAGLLMFYIFSCEIIDSGQEALYPELTRASSTIPDTPLPDRNRSLSGQDPAYKIQNNPDQQPVPPGGLNNFFQYVQENLVYPEEAEKSGAEGKVFVEFIVNRKGKIEAAKAIRGFHPACDALAVDIVKNSPDWIPGSHEGQPVDVRMILPISFVLGPDKDLSTADSQLNDKS